MDRQKAVPLQFEGHFFPEAFRPDAQHCRSKPLLACRRLLDLRLGLSINFAEVSLKDGIKRIINGYG